MATLDELMDLSEINECAWLCTRQSRWKDKTQRYLANLLLNNLKLNEQVLDHTYRVSPTTDFELNERGHIRQIEAPLVPDRIVQKSLVRNVLMPSLRPYLIYDNYASLEGRGTSMARKRFDMMLHRFFFKYGMGGYVLLIDIRKYFENIDHGVLKDITAPRLKDQPDEVMQIIHYVIDESSKSDEGLNLGSEAPQIFAVYFLNPVDHYAKVVRSVKFYARYMDDIAIVCRTKKEARSLLEGIKGELEKLRLEINEKKTHIVRLRHSFVWLQTKYTITSTGHIVRQPTSEKLIRERRRLKAFRRLVDKGLMTTYEALMAYRSWRGSVVADYNAYHNALAKMDQLFWQLFPVITHPVKKNRYAVETDIWNGLEPSDLKYCFIV